MVDISLVREAGLTYNLDLRENSVNCEVQLDAQRRNFVMSDSCYGYYYAGPQHFTQRIDNACLRHQVFLTHSGRGRILLDGQEYIAEPDTVALLNLAHDHRYETLGDHWDYEWVNFTAPCCAYYESQIILTASPFTTCTVTRAFRDWCRKFAQAPCRRVCMNPSR